MFTGNKKYWIIAVICGLLAAALFYQYMQIIKTRYQPDDLVAVVKATVPISKDTIILDEHVKVIKTPAKYIHPKAIGEKADVVGKIAITDIAVDEEILPHKLADKNTTNGEGLAYSIPASKRAVSIPIDSVSGVAGYIEVGNHVDIIATLDLKVVETGEELTFSVVTLQNIEVLAVGNKAEVGKEAGAKTLTLAVSLSDARPLVLASERGSLRLLLRPAVDKSTESLAPYGLGNFLNLGQGI